MRTRILLIEGADPLQVSVWVSCCVVILTLDPRLPWKAVRCIPRFTISRSSVNRIVRITAALQDPFYGVVKSTRHVIANAYSRRNLRLRSITSLLADNVRHS